MQRDIYSADCWKKGEKARFDYKPESGVFKTYQAHSGQMVEVIRAATEDELDDDQTASAGLEASFWVRASDQWEGLVFASELTDNF